MIGGRQREEFMSVTGKVLGYHFPAFCNFLLKLSCIMPMPTVIVTSYEPRYILIT